MIRVLLVHDSHLFRSALAALVGSEPDMEVITASWRHVHSRARSERLHVCVMDAEDADCPGGQRAIGVGELTGTPDGQGTADGGCGLLILANTRRPGRLRRAHEARPLGYIDRDAPPDRLLDAIRHVARGERYVDESLGYAFLQAAEIPLTERELSVLSLAAQGASVAEIAHSLHLSNGTIRNYMAAITRKTGARNRVDAIRISQVAGWV
ncbi:response regulator transcription factor [Streptomyces sp. B1866]|uniref:response regulator transcription factor n=1 Tax=Streptomyces sp. B1866 TaxID=3075431 RepID=UPI0028924527|nr:response regulator transcription factor [Streptomyces sp. B1866]MDT3400313.1 response regulator transcription factor [Streptomyces sp. B1866]